MVGCVIFRERSSLPNRSGNRRPGCPGRPGLSMAVRAVSGPVHLAGCAPFEAALIRIPGPECLQLVPNLCPNCVKVGAPPEFARQSGPETSFLSLPTPITGQKRVHRKRMLKSPAVRACRRPCLLGGNLCHFLSEFFFKKGWRIPSVIRQQVRSFALPEGVADWQPKLQHWAGLIASPEKEKGIDP